MMSCGHWDISLITCFFFMVSGVVALSDVVKNFTCVYYSRMKMNCTWSLTSESPDLQLFYNSGSGGSQNPCVSYIGSGLIRTGCHLHGEEFLNDSYHFLVNGTHNDAFFQNLFKIEPKQLVKIPPLKLNITTDQKRIYFQSSSPDFQPVCWVYHFYYTKCDEGEKSISGMDSRQSLEYDESCSYRGRVKAIYSSYCGKGESDISEPVYYGVNRDPNWTLKVALITPVIVSCCLIVALVLFRRHKDSIFPEIPAPPLLLKDVLNSNKDKVLEMGKLYVPYEDVVEKISLEPESTFHRCES